MRAYVLFTFVSIAEFNTIRQPHALRRRQMARGFSPVSLKKMKELLNWHIQNLSGKMHQYAKAGESFDLKGLFARTLATTSLLVI